MMQGRLPGCALRRIALMRHPVRPGLAARHDAGRADARQRDEVATRDPVRLAIGLWPAWARAVAVSGHLSPLDLNSMWNQVLYGVVRSLLRAVCKRAEQSPVARVLSSTLIPNGVVLDSWSNPTSEWRY